MARAQTQRGGAMTTNKNKNKKSAAVARQTKSAQASPKTSSSFRARAEAEAQRVIDTVHVAAKPPKRVRFSDDNNGGSGNADDDASASSLRKRQRQHIDGGDDDDDNDMGYVDSSSDDNDDDNDRQSDLSSIDDDDVDDDDDGPRRKRAAAADDDDNPFVRSRRDGTPLAYRVLCLRFLPAQFEEPQLYKFLGQFGARVLNCFCVRSRRTHQSKGIAYVQFDSDAVLPQLVEECHGMALGGRALQARVVTLHRAMPTREAVMRRHRLAYVYRTRGAPLRVQRHRVLHKNAVALLIKAARTERRNNAHLAHLGIDYASELFATQLRAMPRALLTRRVRGLNSNKKTHVSTTTTTTTTTKAEEAKSTTSDESAHAEDTPVVTHDNNNNNNNNNSDGAAKDTTAATRKSMPRKAKRARAL